MLFRELIQKFSRKLPKSRKEDSIKGGSRFSLREQQDFEVSVQNSNHKKFVILSLLLKAEISKLGTFSLKQLLFKTQQLQFSDTDFHLNALLPPPPKGKLIGKGFPTPYNSFNKLKQKNLAFLFRSVPNSKSIVGVYPFTPFRHQLSGSYIYLAV